MNEVIQAIKSRRSVRKFRPDQISEAELAEIIEAGCYAPTACNEQPWHFSIVQDEEFLRRISELAAEGMKKSSVSWQQNMGANPEFRVTYGAPTLIVVSGRSDATAPRADCAAATQNMLLAAKSLGIGSVWLGLVRYLFASAPDVALLELPVGYEPLYAAAFGYPSEQSLGTGPKRNLDCVSRIGGAPLAGAPR